MAQLLKFFADLPMGKKLTLGLVLLATIGGIYFVIQQSSRAGFQVLYSRLSPEDTGAIISYLKERKIPYRVEGLSGAVMVPADKVYELRLELASKGLPSGGAVGFEIFDKGRFGMTEFMQKVNYQRALQGELARTICKLEEVEECRVHLVLPPESPFVEKERKPRCAVVLKLRSGRHLSEDEVRGIIHLVASSVEGLDPEWVTVIDTKGKLLSPLRRGGTTLLSAEQLEFQRRWERALEEKIESLLTPVVGQGKVVARVSSEMEWRKVEMTEERYDPKAQVIRSRQSLEENAPSTVSQGVPGVASNLTAARTAKTMTTSNAVQRRSETVNYEVGRIVTHTVEPTGRIKRLQVAVLVDGTYKVVKGEGGEKREYVPRPPEEIKKMEEMVKKAVGFDPSRGDEVVVVNLPFETAEWAQGGVVAEAKPTLLEVAFPFLRYLTPALLLVMIFTFVVRPLMKGMVHPAQAKQKVEEEEGVQEEARPRPLPLPKELALQAAREDTQLTAHLIRRWLEERKRGGS